MLSLIEIILDIGEKFFVVGFYWQVRADFK